MTPLPPASDKPLRIRLEKHWTDWLKTFFVVLAVGLCVFIFSRQATGLAGTGVTEVTFDEHFVERSPVAADEKVDTIGLIDLQGLIVSEDVAANELSDQAVITPDIVRTRLADFHPDAGFSAVVIRMTTPGGMVTASDEIGRIVSQYSKNVLPVFIYSDDLLASGGYYIAVNADGIFAHKLATVGSIGVIYEIPNIQVLAKQKLGVDLEVYKTGQYKDMNNPLRNRTVEEKRMIDADLQENLQAFLSEVQEGRKFTAKQARSFATGRVWSGQEAAKLGLIDGAFYDDELADKLREVLQTNHAIVYIRYDEPPSLVDEVLDAAGVRVRQGPELALTGLLEPLRAGSYYLFRR